MSSIFSRGRDKGASSPEKTPLSSTNKVSLRDRFRRNKSPKPDLKEDASSVSDIEELEQSDTFLQNPKPIKGNVRNFLGMGGNNFNESNGASSSSSANQQVVLGGRPKGGAKPTCGRALSGVARAKQEEAELEGEVEPAGAWTTGSTEGRGVGRQGSSFKVHGNPAFETDHNPQTNRGTTRNGGRGGRKEESSDSDEDSEVLAKRKDSSARRGVLGGPLGRPILDNSNQRTVFLNTPSPNDKLVQCYIKREKDRSGMYPQFKLYLQDGDQFLLAARRRKKSQTSNYLISLDPDDLARGGAGFFGKLRSNYVGTQYVLYDSGLKPGKNIDVVEERNEKLAVLFKPTALDIKGGPRMMTVVVPFPQNFDGRLGVSREEDGDLKTRWKTQKKGKKVTVIALKNKKPTWDTATKGYCLDFRGRVTEPSVKNFQLVPVSGEDHGRVVLQFGKCGSDSFALDFSHPLTPFQAFGICLSGVDGKLCYSV